METDSFSDVCRLALLVLNGIAIVKSVDFIIMGSLMSTLEPLLDFSITKLDAADVARARELYADTSLFLLIAGPVTLLVSLFGFFGARQSKRISLALYILLQVILIIIVVVYSIVRMPTPFQNPDNKWQQLSSFLLASIILVCAIQGITVFLSVVVISSLREHEKVHPTPREGNVTDKSQRPPPSFRRNSYR
ncbi:uncharacterized protein LOC124126202 isoform X1 [Haliotis rufescens]|uniref:uncharacterized protein LOC124126202 isoform X1 n=2 Tax=Haliotis rufescens TaxID=6454 RepID=UPI00201F2878|nr:uncharacterized protein LOC124126202 isoform X1 [Haliotis rufescens]